MLNQKYLFNIVRKNLQEMAMDYEPGSPSRPDPGVERKLAQQDTPLKKIPFPKTDKPNQNFQELLASSRYRQVVDNVRKYVGITPNVRGMQGMGPLTSQMMQAHNTIVSLENRYRTQLEKLAVDLVKETFDISDEDVEFDARIVGMHEITGEDFLHDKPQNQNQEPVDVEKSIYSKLEKLDLEKAKRRLINSIVQGASKRGHFMYHMVGDKIEEITGSDRLLDLYGTMMSINDIVYWQMSDESIKSLGGSIAGKEKVESPKDENSKSKIYARGINFPVLLHELIKGVLELIAMHGRPDDEEVDFADVEKSEDTLEKEMWDLRLGPAIWSKLWEIIPDNVLSEENKKFQKFFFMELFSLPSKDFLVFVKEVLSGSPNGKKLMVDFVASIQQMINDEEYNDKMDEFSKTLNKQSGEIDDDDLYGFLDGLGIDKPKQ